MGKEEKNKWREFTILFHGLCMSLFSAEVYTAISEPLE